MPEKFKTLQAFKNQNKRNQTSAKILKDLHYTFERRLKADGNEEDDDDVARQGIVPMETPFLMDQVMDDGIAACSIM